MGQLSETAPVENVAERGPGVPEASDIGRTRYRAAVVVLMCFSFAASYIVYRIFVPLGSGDLDEGVYVFQAHMLLHGLVSLPADRYGEFFRPWLSGQHDGRIFTVYQIGFPAFLAASQLIFGSMHVGMALIAALIIPAAYGFTMELIDDRRIALTAVIFWALTPMFVLHSALLLSYPLSLLALLAAGWAVLRGARIDSSLSFVLGGLLFGVVVLTRPFDAIPFGIPVALLAAYRLHRGADPAQPVAPVPPVAADPREPNGPQTRPGAVAGQRSFGATLRRVVVPMFGGLVPSLLVTLWFNWQATGSALDFPNVTADPLNTFGFGDRRLLIGQPIFHYNVSLALHSLKGNITAAPGWLFGGPLLLVLAVVGIIRLGRSPETLLLVVLAVAYPIGYFFWWATALSSTGATNGLGPHYYIPSFVPVVILGAVGFDSLVRRRRWFVAAGGFLVLVGVTAYAIPDKAQNKLNVTHAYQPIQRAMPGNLDHAVVFVHTSPPVPYILKPYPFLQTDPALHGDVLYAEDRGIENERLMRRMPTRKFYVFRLQYEPGDALFKPTGGVTELRVAEGPTVTVSIRPTERPGTRFARAYLSVGGHHEEVALDPESTATNSRVEWKIAPTGSGRGGPGVVTVPDTGSGTLTVGIETSNSPTFAHPQRVETRMPYRARPSEITTIAPGLGWTLVQFPQRASWLPSDVSSRIAVSVTSAPG